MTLFTIGHSNQPVEPFLGALQAADIRVVADVRRFPSSRRHPQFGGERLRASLASVGIEYVHLPGLGGHRVPLPESHNTALREEAFRGYADYMETAAFADAVTNLLAEAEVRLVAVMCAERDWRQCHRGLIADYLTAHGHEVVHVLGAGDAEPHAWTKAARIVDGRLSYRGLL